MPESKDKIHLYVSGEQHETRYLTVESAQPGRCVIDLTPMKADGDDAEYRLACKVQALQDVLDGRLRQLQSQNSYGTFERDGDLVWISFHRAEPTRVSVRVSDMELLLAKLKSGRPDERSI